MIRYIDRYDEAYEAFIAARPEGHLFQSQLWAGVKQNWRWLGVAAGNDDGSIRGTASLLIRRLPATPWSVVYVPRGPVCAADDVQTLRELLAGVLQAAKKARACTVKMDPGVPAEKAAFLHEAMTSAGFCLLPEEKDFGLIQPQYVVRLNTDGKTAEELFAALKAKTRYNIRLAQRRGVAVRVCTADEALDDFYALMEETGRRDHFVIRPKAYFRNMLHALGPHARLYMAYTGDTALAGAIALQYGDKTWYSYGASSGQHREMMPNYLLQWQMILWAVESGSRIYDFRGVSGNMDPDSPLYGLWRFKSGWNGSLIRFVGEYDCILNPAADWLMRRAIPAVRRCGAAARAVCRLFRTPGDRNC